MALAEMLENLPPPHKDYDELLYLFRELALGIKNTQKQSDGLWCQMTSKAAVNRNYPETSGSGMIIYALKKGVRAGWLDQSFNAVADKGWKGLKNHISTNSDGKPQINSFNPGMGIKDKLEDYLAVRPVSSPS